MLHNYMPKKKFKTIVLFLLICSILLFAACQSTPESEAVLNKSSSNLEEKILNKAASDEGWTNEKIIWQEKA